MVSPSSDPPRSIERPPVDPPVPPDLPASHRSSIAGGLIALVVLVGLFVAIAFALKPGTTGPHERVLFVGDSITDQARSALTRDLPADDTLDIEAVPGRKFDEMLPFARQAAQAHPNQVVINLGSNDVLLGEDDAVTTRAMTEMSSLFVGTPCVHVVTVNESFAFGKDQGAHARRINDQLRQIAAERGYSVIDWNQMVVDYKHSGQVNGPITSDSVHPTDMGKEMLIGAIGRSLAHCQGPVTSGNT
jgi:hypothetical protein